MRKTLQFILLICGVVALVILLADIGISVAATMHSNTAARVVQVQAGPYPLTVSLYKDPADAGYALPFSIASTQPLNYDVNTVPQTVVEATSVRASLSPDATNRNITQGTAEITVQGSWLLHIVASGPQGQGTADVLLSAVAPPAIPDWLGWLIGGIPVVGLLLFLSLQRGKQTRTVIA